VNNTVNIAVMNSELIHSRPGCKYFRMSSIDPRVTNGLRPNSPRGGGSAVQSLILQQTERLSQWQLRSSYQIGNRSGRIVGVNFFQKKIYFPKRRKICLGMAQCSSNPRHEIHRAYQRSCHNSCRRPINFTRLPAL
jgi:hypothetical protein